MLIKCVLVAAATLLGLGCASPIPTSYPTHPASMLLAIETDTLKYWGHEYAFRGQVLQADQRSDGWRIHMTVGGSTRGRSLVAVFPRTRQGVLLAGPGDSVSVLGTVQDRVTMRNALGGAVVAVYIEATGVVNHTRGIVVSEPDMQASFGRWKSGTLPKASSW